ncbi:hypothetical protein CCACVL1_16269 [Corchorus capsularis]|uniref:TF-B3 domain-containing protein n=1 Tax=Corchorus capsularis TaxID=210143 RepID=A0A1R3HY34_COCAP|nr:hypothetical protein CCACVL1_16269 [Corchorus capsularis]
MALCSKIIEHDDTGRYLTINQIYTEPFPSAAASGKLRVEDNNGIVWILSYRVKSGGTRVFSGDWPRFVQNYKVKAGNTIVIGMNGTGSTDHKIEVM